MNIFHRLLHYSNFIKKNSLNNISISKSLNRFLFCVSSLKINHSISDAEFLEFTNQFNPKLENLDFLFDDSNSIKEEQIDQIGSKNNPVDFSNPPLTRFVRNFLNQLKQQNFDFICRFKEELFELDNEEITPKSIETVSLETVKPSVITIAKFDLQPNGENFVDDSWSQVLSDKNYKIWRKEIENNGQTEYIHKVLATYNDITARSFLEVQLNLDLRTNWDDHIISLNAINKQKEENFTEIIHWVTKFPFPLADREYLYMRRWAKAKIPNDKEISIIINKSAPSEIYNSIDYAEVAKGKLMFSPENLIKVEKYLSLAIIQPHDTIDKKGFNFYLIYYDDPKFKKIPGSSLKWISSKTIPKFMDQVYRVAKRIENDGIPNKIKAIFVSNDLINKKSSIIDKKYAAREIDQVAISAFYKTNLFPSWLRPQRSEKHHLIFT